MKHIIHNQLYIYNFICLISCRLKISFCPILWKKGRKKIFSCFLEGIDKREKKIVLFLEGTDKGDRLVYITLKN